MSISLSFSSRPRHANTSNRFLLDRGSTRRVEMKWFSKRLLFCYSGSRRKRRAFMITETELNVMAALAMIGLSSRPKNG